MALSAPAVEEQGGSDLGTAPTAASLTLPDCHLGLPAQACYLCLPLSHPLSTLEFLGTTPLPGDSAYLLCQAHCPPFLSGCLLQDHTVPTLQPHTVDPLHKPIACQLFLGLFLITFITRTNIYQTLSARHPPEPTRSNQPSCDDENISSVQGRRH